MKYQLTIIAETLGELQTIVSALPGVPVVLQQPLSPSQVVAPTPTLQVPPPQVLEDEDEGEDVPAAFQIPNVAPATPATVVPSLTPVPAVTAGFTTPVGAELDPRGYPWDGRIHASTKTRMKADNTWKKAKGVAEATVEAVEAELRSKGYGIAGSQPQVSTVAPVPATPAALQVPAAPTAPTAPSVPAVPGMPAPANSPAVLLKNQLVKGMQAGFWTAPQLHTIVKAAGIQQLNDIGQYTGSFEALGAAVSVIERLRSLVKSERVTEEWLTQVATAFGFSDVFSITGNLAMTQSIVEYLDQNGL